MNEYHKKNIGLNRKDWAHEPDKVYQIKSLSELVQDLYRIKFNQYSGKAGVSNTYSKIDLP